MHYSFASEVHHRFGAPASGWGLIGPVEGGVVLTTVTYHLDRLSYEWMLDGWDPVTEGSLSIDLDDLVAGVGLAARQDVRIGAQTWHSLQKSVASQVEWLARVHPELTGSEAENLLRSAGARLFTPDLD